MDSMTETRTERDLLGERSIPAGALWGIHTQRAVENFTLTGRPAHPALIAAYGQVKRACAQANFELGYLTDEQFSALSIACDEMTAGALNCEIRVDALQGGAGTSLNMNVNEVLANRALVHMGHAPGDYAALDPLDHVNLHQSTNDTYPTAMRVAAMQLLATLEPAVVALQEAFQAKEREFAHVVRVARTQLQDAVLTTLGRQMGAYAEAFNRDRWRIYKCNERLRVINLGGTAIGTGLDAPRQYIFAVTERLRELTGLGLARGENLIEATQNFDVFVEVSGILKALAASLCKTATDLRLLASGPSAGFGEIRLPAVQSGSSIMPGKVNPVICEAVTQAAIATMANDVAITQAAAMGNLELNAFGPLVADKLLESISLLTNACEIFTTRCVIGIEADEARCRQLAESSTAILTALVQHIGYQAASDLAKKAAESGASIRRLAVESRLLDETTFDQLTSPEAVTALGFRKPKE